MLLSEQFNPDTPRILVTAVESCVYHAPATDYAILNVSTRVPPTGRGRVALPPKATLVKNSIRWPADPATHWLLHAISGYSSSHARKAVIYSPTRATTRENDH